MYANQSQIILDTACMIITREPVGSNASELITKIQITGVVPVQFNSKPAPPNDQYWTYRFNTVTIVRIYTSDGRVMDIELQEITNQPTWSSGTLSDLQQAVMDINTWLTGVAPPSFDGYFVIMAGQSNGTDRFTISGNLSPAMAAVLPDSYSYWKPDLTKTDNGNWDNYQAGVNTQNGVSSGLLFGIGASLSYTLNNTYSKECFIVPTAIGGTYLANDVNPSWNVDHYKEYYHYAVQYCILPAYFKIRNTKNLKPLVIWTHGESDSDTLAHGNVYETELTDFINLLRQQTGFEDMPVIINKIRSDYGGPSLGLSVVRSAMDNVATNLSNVYVFDCDTILTPLSTDGQHYNPITASFSGVQSAVNLGIGNADLIATGITFGFTDYWTPTVGYSVESTALFSRFSSDPGAIRKNLIDGFIKQLQSGLYYRNITRGFDMMNIRAAHDSQSALLDWLVNRTSVLGGVSSPTFTVDRGFTGSGSGYIDTAFDPSIDGAIHAIDDMAVAIYVRTNISSVGFDFGHLDTIRGTIINSRNALNDLNVALNQTSSVSNPIIDGKGLIHVIRTSSASSDVYVNGVFIFNFTNNSNNMASLTFYEHAINYIGGVFGFGVREIAASFVLDTDIDPAVFYNLIQNEYMVPVGANV